MSLVEESEHLSIPFLDIQTATKNFSTLIGKGGYGKVYKGQLLLSGKLTTVAVKQLDSNVSGQGFKEFLTEIQLLSRYKHPNLISLLGFCQENNEKILVYEYAEHGSLDNFLGTTTTPLTYKQRISICIGAARGLDYLHNHIAKNHRVIHRDIKSANVLIDHNWKAMISDLGLSKIGRANENDTYVITNASGTHGYCDPVYMDTGILTKESDVYSFGVVLFEVLCGRLCFKNVNDERRFLGPLARRYYEKGKLDEIIDPVLKDQLNSDSMNKISEIAYQCLLNDRSKRPSMGLVLEKLKEAYKIQEINGWPLDYESKNEMTYSPLEDSSNEELYPNLSTTVLSSEQLILQKLEASQKELEDLKATTEEALKKAEVAKEAKLAVELELRRWRAGLEKKREEEKKIAEERFPIQQEPQKQKRPPKPKKKNGLFSNLVHIFQNKNSQVEGGSSSDSSYFHV